MGTAVDGFVDAALFVRTISMAHGADINDICILGIDYDTADLPRVLQANVIPRSASVSGLVDAVSGREILAYVGLAGARINNIWIGGGHGQGTDRADRLTVKNRRPDDSGVN